MVVVGVCGGCVGDVAECMDGDYGVDVCCVCTAHGAGATTGWGFVVGVCGVSVLRTDATGGGVVVVDCGFVETQDLASVHGAYDCSSALLHGFL